MAPTPHLARRRNTAPGEVHVGDLGSGSDYTPFFQHEAVPSTDIGSGGPYGVYHSTFDDYTWFVKNADPTFMYEQQQARVFGLELLHMADADVLPYNFAVYGTDIMRFVDEQATRAANDHVAVDFAGLKASAARFAAAGKAVQRVQLASTANPAGLNQRFACRGGSAARPGRAAEASRGTSTPCLPRVSLQAMPQW